MPTSLDNFRWLATTDGGNWLEKLAVESNPGPNLVARLRKDLSADRVHALLEQVELRRRAREKFSHASGMLFTRRGLEQSTDHWVAEFKSLAFPSQTDVIDLCCGIGGDAIAFASRGSCSAIDRDPIMAFLAEHNAGACGIGSLQAHADDAAVAIRRIGNTLCWHVDPDRRVDGRRHSRVEAYEPGIELLSAISSRGRGGAIKLAPTAALPPELSDGCHREWISRGGECKQCVAWYGELASKQDYRTASVLGRRGAPLDRFTAKPITDDAIPPTQFGRYIYDPDAALLASGLVEALAMESGLSQIDRHSRYLTGDRLIERAVVTPFEVVGVLKLDIRRLKAALAERNIGQIEWKKRGVDVELVGLAKKCKTNGELEATVMLTSWQNQVHAVMCRRLPKTEPARGDDAGERPQHS